MDGTEILANLLEALGSRLRFDASTLASELAEYLSTDAGPLPDADEAVRRVYAN